MNNKFLLVLVILIQTCLATSFAQTREYLTVDGKQRTMLVYVPKNLPENAPLVITLHGFNQSAQYQMEHTKWNSVAESEKFIVVYPDYDGGWWDVNGTKDTRFIEKIMENMNQRYGSDLNRVYISGFSLGAMMTYHCIEVLANKVAAFAPVSGVRFDNKAPVSPRVVPIIHTHCKGDDVFKWGGDPGHASGGYPYIPDYVKSWAVYFGMNPEPEFIDPYPANKSNSDVDLTIYKKDDSVAEVRLLSFDDAGHWHVDADGWGGVSTTWEIWNFCKRYTLNLEEVTPPVLIEAEPEDCSFDLPDTQREFTFTFDRAAWKTEMSAKLVGKDKTINMQLKMPEDPDGLKTRQPTFLIPEDETIEPGDYKLTLDGICTSEYFTRSYSFEYTYGYEETGDKLNVETIFDADLNNVFKEQGECVPAGWLREGSESCLKNVGDEANVAAGLYLTVGNDAVGKLIYGKTTGYLVNMPIGKYVLSFNSSYWDKGSQRGKALFDVSVISRSNRGGYKTVLKETEIVPLGIASDNGANWESKAAFHEYTMNVTKKDNYVFHFEITKPKVKVFVGNIKVTTAPSNADRYKGEFLRLLKKANDLYESAMDSETSGINELKTCIDKYATLSSTAPSVYKAAIDELKTAMQNVENAIATAIEQPSASSVSTTYYTIEGRYTTEPIKGINIMRTVSDNGTTEVKKLINK